MKVFQRIFILLLIFKKIEAQTYNWPIFPPEFVVSSTFGEFRLGFSYTESHFHEGIDIPATTSKSVFPITLGFQVGNMFYNPQIGWVVEVRHYKDDCSTVINEGSRYLHMNAIDEGIQPGEIYCGDAISTNTTFVNNHLHLELKRPYQVPLENTNSINPFTIPALRIDDYQAPIIKNLTKNFFPL